MKRFLLPRVGKGYAHSHLLLVESVDLRSASRASRKLVSLAVLSAALAAPAYAQQAAAVQAVQIQGAKRISEERIRGIIDLTPNEPIDDQRIQQIIHNLYNSGYFSDIQVFKAGNNLVVQVKERPTIASFSITGNKQIKTEDLTKGLRQIGLAEGRVFDRSILDQVTQELRRQYFSNGRYGVEIETKVEDLPDNRVNLAIVIDEADVAVIRGINIVGNHAFKDDELKAQLNSRTTAWWRFFGSSDHYSQQNLAGDLESLTSYYQNRGYINFVIDSTQVSLSPDRKSIYITINVDEGARYKVSGVQLSGELILPAEELRKLISIKPGDVFSREAATQSAKDIGDRLGDEGYAFAKAEPVPEIDDKNHTVNLNFVVQPGSRYYVRHVNFSGNYKTRDEVLRQETRQLESSLFSATSVARTRTRLARLPFIENVDVETVPVPGSNDLVDVNYTVAERSAGAFQVGVGYSSGQGIILNANVSHSNFLGTGNRVSVDFVTSDYSKSYSASLTEPYYTVNGVSRTISGFYQSTSRLTQESSRYSSDSVGGTLSYGIPLSEYDSLRLGTSLRSTQLHVTEGVTPQRIIDFTRDNGKQFDTLLLETGWIRDTRNRTIFADRGYMHRLLFNVTAPVLDLDYYTLDYNYVQYFPFSPRFVGAFNLKTAYGDAFGNTTDLPPYEKLFAGGINSVRGYKGLSLGPRDEFDNPLGGNFRFTTQTELFFPTLIPNSRNTRFSVFFDAGNVFEQASDFRASDLRTSVGVGFQWLTPILGMMQFAIAKPINEKSGDDTELFSFTFGTTF